MNTRDPGDEPIGDAADKVALDGGVLAIFPPAGHDVIAFFELGEQIWNVGRIILQIGIDGYDDVSTRMIETRHHGGGLAIVAGKIDDPKLGVEDGQSAQDLQQVVGAAIVNHNHFERLTEPVQDRE